MTERTILCFGDSNTHGSLAMRGWNDRRRLGPAERWPGVMAAALGEGWRVIEEGHPGRNAVYDDPVEGQHKNGLRALPVMLETHCPLDLVIMMLGTNDLKARFAVPAEDIALGLERLVVTIRQSVAGPEMRAPAVLMVAPVPVIEAGLLAPMFGGAAEKSRKLGPLLAEVAERQGTAFLDLAPVAEVDPVDGIHLDAAAHAAIGRAMAGKVTDIMGSLA